MTTLVKLVVVALCLLQTPSWASDLQKIQFIQNHFDNQAQHSTLWQNGWLTIVVANTAVNASANQQADSRKERIDTGTALAVGALGITSSLLRPMQIHRYADQLSDLTTNNETEVKEKRRLAERWLSLAAAREEYEASRKNRLTSGVVHGIAGLVVSAEGSGEKAGVASFLIGLLFSELKIRTAPNKSLTALTNYRLGVIDSGRMHDRSFWSIQFDGRTLNAMLNF